jgi:hypothetical protein
MDQTWKEKGGQHGMFADLRLDNLRNLADATQQLYLDMPSYHTWIEAERKKHFDRRKRDSRRNE